MKLTIDDEWSVEMQDEKIKIVGIGDGGITIAEKLLKSNKIPAQNLSLIRCDVSINTLSSVCFEECREKISVMESFYLENIFSHGLGTLGNIEQGEEICYKNRKIIEQMLGDCHKVIICAALGGGFGSGFVSYISNNEMMKENIHLYLIYPSRVVSQKRQDNAGRALERLKNSGVRYTLFYTDKIVEEHYEELEEKNMLKLSGGCSLSTEIVAKEILKDIEPYLGKKKTMDEVYKEKLQTYQKYASAIASHYSMPTIPPSGKLDVYKAKAQRIYESLILCKDIMNQELEFKYNDAKKYEFKDSRYCIVFPKTVEEICEATCLMENTLDREMSRVTIGEHMLFFLKDLKANETIFAFLVRGGKITWWLTGSRILNETEKQWMRNYRARKFEEQSKKIKEGKENEK